MVLRCAEVQLHGFVGAKPYTHIEEMGARRNGGGGRDYLSENTSYQVDYGGFEPPKTRYISPKTTLLYCINGPSDLRTLGLTDPRIYGPSD